MDRRRVSFSFAALPLLFALVACISSHPSVREVIDKAGPATCEKAQMCFDAATFKAAFPGGVSDCVKQTTDTIAKQRGDDFDKSSVCTDAELDECITKLKASTCPGGNKLPTVPCNC